MSEPIQYWCTPTRVHHRYTPGYQRQTHTCTCNGSVPTPWVRVWSWVPSLVPVPVPTAGIPVGDEQGGRAKVRATQVTKYHFRIQDWYDQSNPTISESPEPPEPPEPPGTIWFRLELTGTTGSVGTHSSELGSPLIDITTLFIPPCSIHSH